MTWVFVGLAIIFVALLIQIFSLGLELQKAKSRAIVLETILRKYGKVIDINVREYDERVARGFATDIVGDKLRIKFL